MKTTPAVADSLAYADLQRAPGARLAISQLVTAAEDPVWIVDSLNVQNTLLQMLPASQRNSDEAVRTIVSILRNASNPEMVHADAPYGSGLNEAAGDVLENVLNALAGLAFGPLGQPRLKGSRNRNGWHSMEAEGGSTGRASFYAALQLIQRSELFKRAVVGEVSLALVASASEVMQNARIDFGAFAALYGLSPFVFTSSTTGALEAIVGRNWGAIYDDWQADQAALMAGATMDQLHVTDQWLNDRGVLLERKWSQAR